MVKKKKTTPRNRAAARSAAPAADVHVMHFEPQPGEVANTMLVEQLRKQIDALTVAVKVRDVALQERNQLLGRAQDIVDAAVNDARDARQLLRDQEHEFTPTPESCGLNAPLLVDVKEPIAGQDDRRSWGGGPRAKKAKKVESIIDPAHPSTWGGGDVRAH